MDPRPWTLRSAALLGLTIVAWGMNYVFVRIGLGFATPLWLAALRAATGVAALGVYLLIVSPRVRLSGSERLAALLLGLPNTALFLGLWFVAAQRVAPGQSAVLIYTFPLWVALLSVPILRARLGVRHWAAVAGGFSGVLLVSQPWAGGATRPPPLSVVELLAAAVSWAVATVVVQRRFRPEEMAAVNGYQLLSGAAALVAVALLLDPRHLPADVPSLWISVAWLGVFGTAFAYAVWFDLLGRIPAATLSGYSFLVPLVALGASAVWLGERLDAIQAIGVLLVVLSIYGITRAASRGGGPTGPAAGDALSEREPPPA